MRTCPCLILLYVCLSANGTTALRGQGFVDVSTAVGLALPPVVMRRMVKSGTGYMGGNDLRVHFGLGPATVVDRLVIYWPSGQVQEFWNVPVNQELSVHEPGLSVVGAPVRDILKALPIQVQ